MQQCRTRTCGALLSEESWMRTKDDDDNDDDNDDDVDDDDNDDDDKMLQERFDSVQTTAEALN